MATEVLSSSVSELNVAHVQDGEEEVSKDYPVPMQFITQFDFGKKKYVTKVYDHI